MMLCEVSAKIAHERKNGTTKGHHADTKKREQPAIYEKRGFLPLLFWGLRILQFRFRSSLLREAPLFLIYPAMYTIQLPNFHGPFDLLLFFIKRDELNIHDIPIARIANEFLEYTRIIELLDLELAGEFLVMAATLMQIKAKLLLPEEKKEGEGEQVEEDPRAELVRRLLEYKRYKEAAEELQTMSESQRYIYYRQFFEADVKDDPNPHDELSHLTLFDLLAAFSRALQKAPKAPNPHTIEREPVTIEEQAALIMALFAYREEISFSELVAGTDRSTLVVTFLALLEMMRSHNVKIRQQEQFGEIYLCKPVQTEIDESLENVTTKEYPADNAEILNDDDGISSLKELKQRERLARRAHKISLEANRQGDKKPVLFDTN
jgi:segregation and condensation protein A